MLNTMTVSADNINPINKTVINLESDDHSHSRSHSGSRSHSNLNTTNSNTTVPSPNNSNGHTTSLTGTTSLTPIDLTSNAHSYQNMNNIPSMKPLNPSMKASNSSSHSASPLVPKLVSTNIDINNGSMTAQVQSQIRKRPFKDPPNHDSTLLHTHMPQRKRQKIESNIKNIALLNLHNSNHVTNPLNNLQRSLLAGKQSHSSSARTNLSLLNNLSTHHKRKGIDITLVQLVNYLKSQFAKFQKNQTQRNNNTNTNTNTNTQTTNPSTNTSLSQSAAQTQQHNLAQLLSALYQGQAKQQLLMSGNINSNANNSNVLQSILRLKQQQQQQQPLQATAAKQSALLNAINASKNKAKNNMNRNSVFTVSNNSNKKSTPNNGLANLMASLQNIQNINKMNNILSKNRNISNLVESQPQSQSHSHSQNNSHAHTQSPKRKKNNIEIVTLVSDDDEEGELVIPNNTNNAHNRNNKKNKPKNKGSKKRTKNSHKKHTNNNTIVNGDGNYNNAMHNKRRKRKRNQSPTRSLSNQSASIGDNMNSDNSDESYKAYIPSADVPSNNTRRQRRKRMCNIDKEFDEEERMIKYREEMMAHNRPISGNAFIVAYAESLHLDDMKMKKNECFPVLKGMPRSSLIKYCDYYKLRYSKRSKDNRLLQIVTKHFIVHNREKNTHKSITDMENDLFWHSVCYNSNTNKDNKEKMDKMEIDTNEENGKDKCDV